MQLNGKDMDHEMFIRFITKLDPDWEQKHKWHKLNVLKQQIQPYPLKEDEMS